MSTCMNKSMVSQQILTAVMTCIIVDKNTVHAKPHSLCFLPLTLYCLGMFKLVKFLYFYTNLALKKKLNIKNAIFTKNVFSPLTTMTQF